MLPYTTLKIIFYYQNLNIIFFLLRRFIFVFFLFFLQHNFISLNEHLKSTRYLMGFFHFENGKKENYIEIYEFLFILYVNGMTL